MYCLDAVIDIKPRKFRLTSSLLNKSLPKKRIEVLKGLSKKEVKSLIKDSFSKTGVYAFSLLPGTIKNQWVFENRPERYFRLDKEKSILYVCYKKKNKEEVVIGGYDLKNQEPKFKLKEVAKVKGSLVDIVV